MDTGPLPRQEVLLMPDDIAKKKLAIVNLRCEIARTLKGGDCQRAGEVEFGDVLLCRRHAKQLEAHDRVGLLVGMVSSLELSLRSIPLRKDRELACLCGRSEHRQNESSLVPEKISSNSVMRRRRKSRRVLEASGSIGYRA